ncbi:putative toxin [Lysobacter sp. 2RAF19]
MERRVFAWVLCLLLSCVALPASARFVSVDPAPATGSRYAYADGDPAARVDPDGRQSIAWVAAHGQAPPQGQAAAMARVHREGQFGGLRLLAGLFVTQFQDGPGAFAASPANLIRGIRAEARILAALGEAKNTRPVVTQHGRTIPDFENATQVGEIKDAKRVAMSSQLRAQLEHAQATGRTHVVVTGTRTHVTATVEDASTVIRRDDLGPQP